MRTFALLLCGLLQWGAATHATAAACVTASLSDYVALGPGGCTIGGLSFESFSVVSPLAPGNVAVSPAAVTLTPVLGADGPRLAWSSGTPLAAGPGSLLQLWFGFRTTGAALASGDTLLLGGPGAPPAVSGDGAITLIEDLCLDGLFASPSQGCAGSALTQIDFAIAGDQELESTQNFAVSSFFDVFFDLVIDGGTAGQSMLGPQLGEYRIAANGTRPLAEPALPALAAIALAALAMLSRRRVRVVAVLAALALPAVHAANHREAPITAFDPKADITDVYAFRSYDGNATPRVVLIMNVDPLLEPGNGPHWFPFDPDLLYEIKIDNDNDAVEDIVFQIRFTTEQRLPDLFQGYLGAGNGIDAPANSPPPVPPGTMIVPPRIVNFDSIGLGQRQRYTVTMIRGGITTTIGAAGGQPMYAVPANVGPRTMDYAALFNAAIYPTTIANVRVFAGTVDDPFFVDLGGFFDTLNTSTTPVLTPAQDAANINLSADTISGYAVNSIAIEVPVSMLTRTGAVEPATSAAATIGVWATTSRLRTTVRRAPLPAAHSGSWSQIQRMGNPLINELLIGTGQKDRFSMDQPKNDSQFAPFFVDPPLARILNAIAGGAVPIPTPPRTDLLPLVVYAPPVAAAGTPPGPLADLLRLNTGVAPTAPGSPALSRLGLIGGDPAGYPNGRRLFDDVVDISLRAISGVFNPQFNIFPNNRLGDGVNVNDAPLRNAFPYLGNAPSGRARRHIDPGEAACTANGGAACLP